MPIILRLDRVMADRKMSLKELSEKVGVANVNLSKLKTGKVSASIIVSARIIDISFFMGVPPLKNDC